MMGCTFGAVKAPKAFKDSTMRSFLSKVLI